MKKLCNVIVEQAGSKNLKLLLLFLTVILLFPVLKFLFKLVLLLLFIGLTNILVWISPYLDSTDNLNIITTKYCAETSYIINKDIWLNWKIPSQKYIYSNYNDFELSQIKRYFELVHKYYYEEYDSFSNYSIETITPKTKYNNKFYLNERYGKFSDDSVETVIPVDLE
jgi:hypothetical protein